MADTWAWTGTDLDEVTNGMASQALIYGHMGAYMALNTLLLSVSKFFGLKGIERDGSYTHRLAEEQDEENLVCVCTHLNALPCSALHCHALLHTILSCAHNSLSCAFPDIAFTLYNWHGRNSPHHQARICHLTNLDVVVQNPH